MSEAVITSRDLFNSPAPPVQQAPVVQQMMIPFEGGPAQPNYRPMGSSPPYQTIPAAAVVNSDQKRKRGRPRKYGPDGNMGSAPAPAPVNVAMPPQQSFSPTQQQQQQHQHQHQHQQQHQQQQQQQQQQGEPLGSPTVKKARGRPPGSSNKKQKVEALGSTGIGFIPHVLNVKAGEDVALKIMAFSQNGPRAVCVLSANGAIANVTLRQAATSGGTATYEGHFDILSLSGSFMLTEVGGQKSRTGGLSITLAGPDGRVLGGCVAGFLQAATAVQVIVGSFIADGRREPKSAGNHFDPSLAQPRMNLGGAAGTSSSPSRGTLSESSGGPASPLNLSGGAQDMSGIQWK